VKKSEEVINMVFVPNDQAPEILKPGKQAFDLPSTTIPAKFSPVLGTRLFSILFVWCNQFNSAVFTKPLIKAIAVIRFIADNPVRGIFREATVDGLLNQLYFMGRSAFNVSGDRKTSSVCDCHDLGALAALCLADSKTPFFAGTKVPSIKASRISIPPRSYRSCASSWAMSWKTPCLTHCWNRLWHVWYGGYLGGKSFQGAPVRKIHNIPFMTLRGSRALRPRASFTGAVRVIMGSIRFHCSFVSSILIILHNQNVMSSFIFNYFNWLDTDNFAFNFKWLQLDTYPQMRVNLF
jgi:hypothetical protein